MRKLLLIILFLPSITIAQEKMSLFMESNINYAPFGIKVIAENDSTNVGAYFTLKLSEDYFFREVKKESTATIYDEDAITMDINELIVGGGVVVKICKNIDFQGGIGIMMGNKFMLSYSRRNIGTTNNPIYEWNSSDTWIKTNNMMTMPMASFGIVLSSRKFKFSIGNETAFTRERHYMASQLNQKSFARLSSLTFGLGYTFSK